MQTPEEILKNNGCAYEYSYDLRVVPYDYAFAEITQLQSENQTLLDEVNRLNEENEGFRKQLQDIHKSHRGFIV